MKYARELKKGQIIGIDNCYYIVRQIAVKSPSARGAQTLYKVRFNSIPAGNKVERTFTGDDTFSDIELSRRSTIFLYREQNTCTFMDSENYVQYLVNTETIEKELLYISEGQEGITALLVEGSLLGLELPPSVSLKIIETSPAIKGASAAARTKTARLKTGLEVQVPEYLSEGEMIKVNTETGKFISRI